MHEARTPEHEIAEKYDVLTFEEYKAFKHQQDDKTITACKVKNWTPIQELAFTVVYFIHCAGEKQRYLIINRQWALDCLEEHGDVPKEFEGIPLVFDETGLFKISSLA